MKDLLLRFVGDDSAATAIEYGLIVGLIAVALTIAVRNVGTGLSTTFVNLATTVATP